MIPHQQHDHTKIVTWGDVIGPVARESDLSPEILNEPGLIRLPTQQGNVVYPVRQFQDFRLSPWMQKAVILLSVEGVFDAGFHEWTNAGYLMGTKIDGLGWKTYPEVLCNPSVDDEDKLFALRVLMQRVNYSLQQESIDPTKVWDFVFDY